MSKTPEIIKLDNGLVVLAQPMPWLQSVAFNLITPCGTAREPADLGGLTSMAIEMAQRGSGDLTSRQIVDELDFLGVDRSASASTLHASFSACFMPSALARTLEIYASYLQTPHMIESEFLETQQVALQELRALEDDPAHRCFTELKHSRFEDPYGRSSFGTVEGVQNASLSDVRHHWASHVVPNGSILAVAGNFSVSELHRIAEQHFSQWAPIDLPTLPPVKNATGATNIHHDSQQQHIALAFDCAGYGSADYWQTRGMVSVLSDGMSSRLFNEVREKRGLVYTISANCYTIAGNGAVMCYAGTTSGAAQETLNVTLDTINSMAGESENDKISSDEIERLRTRVRTSLIMEQESSMARCSQMATDYHYFARVPSYDEVRDSVFALTPESIQTHFQKLQRDWTLVAIGPDILELPK